MSKFLFLETSRDFAPRSPKGLGGIYEVSREELQLVKALDQCEYWQWITKPPVEGQNPSAQGPGKQTTWGTRLTTVTHMISASWDVIQEKLHLKRPIILIVVQQSHRSQNTLTLLTFSRGRPSETAHRTCDMALTVCTNAPMHAHLCHPCWNSLS